MVDATDELVVVDYGDAPIDFESTARSIEPVRQIVREIAETGAKPFVIGGDHGVPIPVFRAFEGRGPITLVHIDAHLDWRDEVNGAREGYSSPIRRASEMAHIDRIFQVGLRSQGSARAEEVDAALSYGAEIVTAFELHDAGMDAFLARIPDGGTYYLTIDADGMDPAVMPAVAAPAPGGVTYHQACKLIHGLVGKGRMAGMDIVEITPKRDVNDISSITAGRLILNLIGAAVRAGYFEAR
jgi:agmatinase